MSPILPDCLYRFSLAVTALSSSTRFEAEVSDSSFDPLEEPSPSSLAKAVRGPDVMVGEREEGPP